jgi:hydrolase, P-loop family
MKNYESFSENDTFEIAKNIAKELKKGSIVCLDGDLGVGKTIFAKGFAKGLGIEDDITSPTFTLVQSYESLDNVLHHFDVYRISDESEMDEIGYEEYFFSDAICLIEWSSLIPDLIPENAIRISIEKDMKKGFDYRNINIEGI